MNCPRCDQPLGPRVAGFATRPAGEEYVHCWYRCEPCGHYVRDTVVDRFSGDTDRFVDVVQDELGTRTIGLIAQCPAPLDDKCRCLVHSTVGVGW